MSEPTWPVVEVLKDDATGVRVEIVQDEDPSYADPRDNDNLGVMLVNHGSYELGDKDVSPQLPKDGDLSVSCPDCEGDGEIETNSKAPEDRWVECDSCAGHGMRTVGSTLAEAFDSWARANYEVVGPVILLGLIDHSGISMYVGGGANRFDPGGWDSGTVGIIFATRETIELTGVGTKDIEEALGNEVDEYDKYIQGDVYYLVSKDADDDVIESVGGYIGSDVAEQEAKEMLSGAIDAATRERELVAEAAARDVVTV